MTSDEAAAKEQLRLVGHLIDLCDEAGIDRPLSGREVELGLLALHAKVPPKKRGPKRKGPSPGVKAYQKYGLANWFHAATGYRNWETAYWLTSRFLGLRDVDSIKKSRLKVGKYLGTVLEDATKCGLKEDLEYWSWFLEYMADMRGSAPDLEFFNSPEFSKELDERSR